jgi:dihydroorotase
MIKEGAKSGLLRSAKYYPPHGTTNSGGAIPLRELMTNGVLSAMQDNDIILNIHGEKHGTYRSDYFGPKGNAETAFYEDEFQLLRNLFPGLRMVAEHISTETALWAVQACDHRQVKATITPQHLLFSIADMLQGFKYHMACMPVLKFEEDREALLRAVLEDDKHLFAGTDSAPHTKKALACGCAAGCFTGGTAVQLYAMAFERHGNTLEEGWLGDIFRRFLCERGPAIYGFVPSTRTFKLVREPMVVERIATTDGIITPLAVGMAGGDAERNTIPWSVKL